MNIDRPSNIPKRLRTSEYLAHETWRYANDLAANQWDSDGIERVQNVQTVVEVINTLYDVEAVAAEQNGEDEDAEDEDAKFTEPVFVQTTLSFLAVKRYFEEEKDVPFYVVQSETIQGIDKEEIPLHVLDEIADDAEEDGHALHDTMDEGEKFDINDLEDFSIQRTQKVIYEVDRSGELHDYVISYAYSLDGNSIHEVEYSHSGSEMTWKPTLISEGVPIEGKPLVLPLLTESAIGSEVRDIDISFKEFMSDRDLRELTLFSAQPKQEHIRRILGMLSVLTGNSNGSRRR
jgi:hypothetical protein